MKLKKCASCNKEMPINILLTGKKEGVKAYDKRLTCGLACAGKLRSQIALDNPKPRKAKKRYYVSKHDKPTEFVVMFNELLKSKWVTA